LPYATGGAAFGDITVNTPAGGSQAQNKVGWTAGAGVEYAFTGSRWSTKLEYLYVNLGSATCDAAHCGVSTSADFKANVVRLGLNYRF
jgi:outer membrane immunogenic protein